jgi:hypothetical protein
VCGRRTVERKGGRRMNSAQNCVNMYANAKMITVETIPGIGRGG